MPKAIRLPCVLLACAALAVAPAIAQDFPTKQPIKIVVAANAGGLTDALARVTAEFLQRRIKQAVVVENKPGAGSVIGADFTAKSPPDGYTIIWPARSCRSFPRSEATCPTSSTSSPTSSVRSR
jgi:tripartite-type tricarboxylate transporter receptor subunit TctC